MTNRLPKETVTAQTFMEVHLAAFCKGLLNAGHDRKTVLRWAADRFEKGGKYNLSEIKTPFLTVASDAGTITHFHYLEGQVYEVNPDADACIAKIGDLYGWMAEDMARQALQDKVKELAECGIIMIWRMFIGLPDSDSGIPMISYIGGQEKGRSDMQASIVGDQTGVILASAMDIMVQHDILKFIGEGQV